MSRVGRFFISIVGIAGLLLTLALPGVALAHERRTIAGGKYEVVVGWDVEPAFVGQKNAASIRITRAGTDPAEPIEGAEKTLKVQIRQGAQTKDFPLRTIFRQPGYYVADIVPNREGDYVLTFVGKIGEDTIDEKFDSADGKFNGVEPITALQFPVAQGDTSSAALREAQAVAQSAQATARSAETLAYAGIGVGLVGLLAAVAAWATRPRRAAVGPG